MAKSRVKWRGSPDEVWESEAAMETLVERTRELNEAQSLAHTGSWAWDQAADVLRWSDELYRIFGLDRDAGITFERFMAAVHPDDRPLLRAQLEGAAKGEAAASYDLRIVRSDGATRTVQTESRSETGPEGQLLMRGIAQDITERRQAEAENAQTQTMYRSLVEDAGEAIFLTALDGRPYFANRASAELFGYESAARLLKEVQSVANLYQDPADRRRFLAHIVAGNASAFEVQMRKRDGTTFWGAVHAHIVRMGDGAERILGLILDVSAERAAVEARRLAEQQQAEIAQLAEQIRSRTDFLNTAAHDLNNPLTPILIQLSILRQRSGLEEEDASSIAVVERNVNRLKVLIEDMLDAARLQAGRLQLNRTPTLLSAILNDAHASFEEPARQAGLELKIKIEAELPVQADPAKVSQVLYNLLSNSIKYTPRGGHVSVTLSNTGRDVVVSVLDDGLGMDAAQLKRLFEPFVRVHENVPGIPKGTGLGLYICKGIVEQHGGKIWVESPGPGAGSCFSFELPASGADKEVKPPTNRGAPLRASK